MKYLLQTALALMLLCSIGFITPILAQNKGFKATLQFQQGLEGDYVYLAKYFAKPLPNLYKVDSVKVVNGVNTIVFQKTDSFVGGVYVVMFQNRTKLFEILLDNGYYFEASIDIAKLPLGIKFTNSLENELYLQLNQNYLTAKKATQEMAANKLGETARNDVKQLYLDTYQKNLNLAQKVEKDNLFYKLVYASTPPNDPPFTDSAEYIYQLKERYWSNFDLADQRLIHTPLLENKLQQYFEKYVYNFIPDSMIYESQKLLYFTSGNQEMYRYTLHWLTNYTYKSKYMGMDEVFVYLIENYYMDGKATWLDEATLQTYVNRAQSLAPNVLGKKGADIQLANLFDLKKVSLYNLSAPYTLLVFWSIDCGHCIEEIPKLKKVYDEHLKQHGVRVFSVPTGKEQSKIIAAVKQYGIEDWQHAIDIDGSSDYMKMYDAFAKPKVYLLDEQKNIKGKLLNHRTVLDLMNNLTKNKK